MSVGHVHTKIQYPASQATTYLDCCTSVSRKSKCVSQQLNSSPATKFQFYLVSHNTRIQLLGVGGFSYGIWCWISSQVSLASLLNFLLTYTGYKMIQCLRCGFQVSVSFERSVYQRTMLVLLCLLSCWDVVNCMDDLNKSSSWHSQQGGRLRPQGSNFNVFHYVDWNNPMTSTQKWFNSHFDPSEWFYQSLIPKFHTIRSWRLFRQ